MTVSLSTLAAAGFTPEEPSPDWSLLVADTRTGRVTGELPLAGQSWKLPLQWGQGGTYRALIALDGPPGTDDRSVTRRVSAIAAGPWRFMLIACYGGQPAGPWGYTGTPKWSASTCEIGCYDLYALLNRRWVIATGQRANPRSTAADTTIGPGTLPQVVRGLFVQATAEPGAGLPLVLSSPPGVGTETRTYLATELASYAQRIQQLTQVDAGPDIIVTPQLSADRSQVTLRVDIGNPYLGQSGAPWAWNLPGNCVDVEVDVDPSSMGDGMYVPGDGVDKDRPIGVSLGTTLIDQGFPLMDVIDSRFGSLKDQSQLDAVAAAGRVSATKAAESWSLKVRADAAPILGDWRRGDTCTIRVTGHYAIPDGTYTRRIVDVSGDHTDLVTVDTAPVPAGL